MDIDCLLLAGGCSKRMGEPKMLLRLGSGTLFEHVLGNHLASSVRRICAVVPGWLEGFDGVIQRNGCDRVDFVSLAGECEMSKSLKAGWKRAAEMWRPDAILISLADKPLVTSEVIDSVIAGYVASGRRIGVPVYGGERGHPVILSADMESEVYGLQGDRGARDLIDKQGNDVAEVPVDTDGILIDVDTHGDFNEIKRRLNQIG